MQENCEEKDALNEIAQHTLGVQYLYPYQRLVVSNILDAAEEWTRGKNARTNDAGDCNDCFDAFRRQIAIMPTGSGKSLCFQLPAQLLPGPTVVVFPLLSLISDQERRLRSAGVGACVLRGGQSPEERNAVWKRIADRSARIILTNPETFCTDTTVRALRRVGCFHAVIDEAHCVSEWGETFRPTYTALAEAIARIDVPLVTAFTATASAEVLAAVKRILFPKSAVHVIEGNPDRPNITYRVVPSIAPLQTVYRLLFNRGEPSHPLSSTFEASTVPLYPEYLPVRRPALIFCRTRKRAEFVAEYLRDRLPGQDVFFYHAGLTRDEKNRVENWFFASTNGILCSTCAYGMGVDKADIRTVIHFDVPGSVEAYLQEAGRGGRDRMHSEAILIAGAGSSGIDARQAGTENARAHRMLQYARTTDCRRVYLLSLLGAEPDACFGCDICHGSTVRQAEGADAIYAFMKRHPRRYTRSTAAARMASTVLDWQEEDVEYAIGSLVRCRVLRMHRFGPWKHTLSRTRAGMRALDPEALLPV